MLSFGAAAERLDSAGPFNDIFASTWGAFGKAAEVLLKRDYAHTQRVVGAATRFLVLRAERASAQEAQLWLSSSPFHSLVLGKALLCPSREVRELTCALVSGVLSAMLRRALHLLAAPLEQRPGGGNAMLSAYALLLRLSLSSVGAAPRPGGEPGWPLVGELLGTYARACDLSAEPGRGLFQGALLQLGTVLKQAWQDCICGRAGDREHLEASWAGFEQMSPSAADRALASFGGFQRVHAQLQRGWRLPRAFALGAPASEAVRAGVPRLIAQSLVEPEVGRIHLTSRIGALLHVLALAEEGRPSDGAALAREAAEDCPPDAEGEHPLLLARPPTPPERVTQERVKRLVQACCRAWAWCHVVLRRHCEAEGPRAAEGAGGGAGEGDAGLAAALPHALEVAARLLRRAQALYPVKACGEHSTMECIWHERDPVLRLQALDFVVHAVDGLALLAARAMAGRAEDAGEERLRMFAAVPLEMLRLYHAVVSVSVGRLTRVVFPELDRVTDDAVLFSVGTILSNVSSSDAAGVISAALVDAPASSGKERLIGALDALNAVAAREVRVTPFEASLRSAHAVQRGSSVESEEAAAPAAAEEGPRAVEVSYVDASLAGFVEGVASAANKRAMDVTNFREVNTRSLDDCKQLLLRLVRLCQRLTHLHLDEPQQQLLPVMQVLAVAESDFVFGFLHEDCDAITEMFDEAYFTSIDALQLRRGIDGLKRLLHDFDLESPYHQHCQEVAALMTGATGDTVAAAKSIRRAALQQLVNHLRSALILRVDAVELLRECFKLRGAEDGPRRLVRSLLTLLFEPVLTPTTFTGALQLLKQFVGLPSQAGDVRALAQEAFLERGPQALWALLLKADKLRCAPRAASFFTYLATPGAPPDGAPDAGGRARWVAFLDLVAAHALKSQDAWPEGAEAAGTLLAFLLRLAWHAGKVALVVERVLHWCREEIAARALPGGPPGAGDGAEGARLPPWRGLQLLHSLLGVCRAARQPEAGARPEGGAGGGPVCTYARTGGEYVNQHWFHCYTCELSFERGCCSACLVACHHDHDVSYGKLSNFFCDCGAGAAQRGHLACQCSPNEAEDVDVQASPAVLFPSPSDAELGEAVQACFSATPFVALVLDAFRALSRGGAAVRGPEPPPPRPPGAPASPSRKRQRTAPPPAEAAPWRRALALEAGALPWDPRAGAGAAAERVRLLADQGIVARAPVCADGAGRIYVACQQRLVSLQAGARLRRGRQAADARPLDRFHLVELSSRAIGFHATGAAAQPLHGQLLAVWGPHGAAVWALERGALKEELCGIALDASAPGGAFVKRAAWLSGCGDGLLLVANRFVRVATLFPERTLSLVEDSAEGVVDAAEVPLRFAARGAGAGVAVLLESGALELYGLATMERVLRLAPAPGLLEALLLDCSSLHYSHAQNALLVSSPASQTYYLRAGAAGLALEPTRDAQRFPTLLHRLLAKLPPRRAPGGAEVPPAEEERWVALASHSHSDPQLAVATFLASDPSPRLQLLPRPPRLAGPLPPALDALPAGLAAVHLPPLAAPPLGIGAPGAPPHALGAAGPAPAPAPPAPGDAGCLLVVSADGSAEAFAEAPPAEPPAAGAGPGPGPGPGARPARPRGRARASSSRSSRRRGRSRSRASPCARPRSPAGPPPRCSGGSSARSTPPAGPPASRPRPPRARRCS